MSALVGPFISPPLSRYHSHTLPKTSNLVYAHESGGLNEAMSDSWGGTNISRLLQAPLTTPTLRTP